METIKKIDLASFIKEQIKKEEKAKEIKKTNSDYVPNILFDISN